MKTTKKPKRRVIIVTEAQMKMIIQQLIYG